VPDQSAYIFQSQFSGVPGVGLEATILGTGSPLLTYSYAAILTINYILNEMIFLSLEHNSHFSSSFF
jgi:hypothetical protein